MSSHPGKSYPTFILKISEEPIYANASKDKLFGYVIEAPQGPINEPTYVASNEEAIQVFGVDFAPHFYQQPTGLIITRVGIPNAKEASITYNKTGNVECFNVTAVNKGESDISVKVIKSLGLSGGYQLTVTIPSVTSRTFSSLTNAEAIVKTINNKFAKYIKATLIEAEADGESLILDDSASGELTGGNFGYLFNNEIKEHTVDFVESKKYSGYYRPYDSTAVSNGGMGDTVKNKVRYVNSLSLEDKQSIYALDKEDKYNNTIQKKITGIQTLWSSSDSGYDENQHSILEVSDVESADIFVKLSQRNDDKYDITVYTGASGTATNATGVIEFTGKEDEALADDYREILITSHTTTNLVNKKYYIDKTATAGDTIYELQVPTGTRYYLPKLTQEFVDNFSPLQEESLSSYKLFNNSEDEYNEDDVVKTDISSTAKIIYKYAFDLMKSENIVGIAALSELQVVQAALKDHIDECIEEETAILRFGITGFTEYNNPVKKFTINDISATAEEMNSEYMIYIGQGVVFKKIDLTENKGYKILTLNPIQSVMLYTGIRSSLAYDEAIFGGEDKKILQGVIDVLPISPDETLYKTDREELNENGVITFKKEYDRVTFLEGVTTSQDSDVLSYESIMSIVVYVTKRLIVIAKSYQGKKLTEDLKESLKTALSAELQSIQQNDGSLVAIAEYNIPPYDVEVESAAMVRFNEEGQLIRESKVIARVRIVPVGALRDIELGVIVI